MTSSQRRYAQLSAQAGRPVMHEHGLAGPIAVSYIPPAGLGRCGGGEGGCCGGGGGGRGGCGHSLLSAFASTGSSFLKGFGGGLGVAAALWIVGGWMGRKAARSAEKATIDIYRSL